MKLSPDPQTVAQCRALLSQPLLLGPKAEQLCDKDVLLAAEELLQNLLDALPALAAAGTTIGNALHLGIGNLIEKSDLTGIPVEHLRDGPVL